MDYNFRKHRPTNIKFQHNLAIHPMAFNNRYVFFNPSYNMLTDAIKT
ncbi:hypothetical protein CCACVL1_25601, partial [Corchorus capsularis]